MKKLRKHLKFVPSTVLAGSACAVAIPACIVAACSGGDQDVGYPLIDMASSIMTGDASWLDGDDDHTVVDASLDAARDAKDDVDAPSADGEIDGADADVEGGDDSGDADDGAADGPDSE